MIEMSTSSESACGLHELSLAQWHRGWGILYAVGISQAIQRRAPSCVRTPSPFSSSENGLKIREFFSDLPLPVPDSSAYLENNDWRRMAKRLNFPVFFPVSREFGTETGSY